MLRLKTGQRPIQRCVLGFDRRAKRPQRYLGVVKAKGTVTAKQR